MRISDWSSDVCSSDLRSTDAEGRHTLYRGEAFLGQQDIRPWRWLNLVFVNHRHQHLSPDLRFRRPDTAGAIGRFGFAEQPEGLEIGRQHVRTPVTKDKHICSHMLEQKITKTYN